MKGTTWVNNAGQPMAIAASAEEACALWQANLQAALDDGRYSLEDSDGELLRYVVRDTNRVIDALACSNDPNAPDGQAVMAAAEAGELFVYAC